MKQRDGEDEEKHQRSAARVVEQEVAEKLVLRGRCCFGTKSDLTSLIMDRPRTNCNGSSANQLKMVSEHSRALRTTWHKRASKRNWIVWAQ